MRPAEVDDLVGNASKAHKVLGWRPKTGFKQLVEMMVKADIEMERKNSK
jgi:GDPmannose 4,6-dehydratase